MFPTTPTIRDIKNSLDKKSVNNAYEQYAINVLKIDSNRVKKFRQEAGEANFIKLAKIALY